MAAICAGASGLAGIGAPAGDHTSHGSIEFLSENLPDKSEVAINTLLIKDWTVQAAKNAKAGNVDEDAQGLILQRVIPHDDFDKLRGPDGLLSVDKMKVQSWTPIPSDDPAIEAPTTMDIPTIKAGETGTIHMHITVHKPGHYILCYRVVKLVDGEYVPTNKNHAPLWLEWNAK